MKRESMKGEGASCLPRSAMLGPGGKSVLMQPGDQDLIVCPDYHARTGHSALQISILIWQNDWPHAALEK